MKNSLSIALLLSLSLLTVQPSFAAELTDKAVINALEKAHLINAGGKILAKSGGTEAVISTYGFKESKDREKDCKIDATLMARELILNNDFGLTRITVDFYEPDGKGEFKEVIVTKGEVKAFASNAISMDEFLQSLRISSNSAQAVDSSGEAKNQTKVEGDQIAGEAKPGLEESSTAQKEKTEKIATASTSTSKVEPTKAAAPTTKDPGKNTSTKPRFVSEKYGFSFDIPETWVVDEDVIHKDGKLLRLSSRSSRFENNIEFYYHSGKATASQLALEQRKTFNYAGCKFERYEQAKVGRGGYTGAFVVLTYPHESGEEYYEMHCYFGNLGAVYDLRGWCPKNDYRRLAPAFWQIMNSVQIASGNASAKTPAKPAVPKTR